MLPEAEKGETLRAARFSCDFADFGGYAQAFDSAAAWALSCLSV